MGFNKGALVSHAHMHQSGFVPGINKQVKSSLDQESCRGIVMKIGAIGLECEYKGREFIIPYVNFQSIVMAVEVEEKKK